MPKPPVNPDAIKQQIFSDVGYGKPPKQHQFQKGKSGNPLGRPPKANTRTEDIPLPRGRNGVDMHRVLSETIRIKEGGRIREVSKAEALQRKMEQMALNGDSVLLIRQLRKDLQDEDEAVRLAIEKDHAFWNQYRKQFDIFAKVLANEDPLLAEWMNELSPPELKDLWQRQYPVPVPKGMSRDLLTRFNVYRIQEDALGGLFEFSWKCVRSRLSRLQDAPEYLPPRLFPLDFLRTPSVTRSRKRQRDAGFLPRPHRCGAWGGASAAINAVFRQEPPS